MTKSEKATYIIEELEKLYPETPVPLDHYSPYTLLVAVLLSAQCTDERVNKITPNLFAKADTPQDMVKLSIDQIREIIKPCGLSPSKSKAIWNLSQILLDKYNGEVPSEIEKLEELPGVGHKTASVVVSQAFGIPAFPVDTHIHRLLTRWGITNGKSVEQTERDAKMIFPKEVWNKLHIQIIFYGREYSPARALILEKDYITRKLATKKMIAQMEREGRMKK
jgi:endonuclease-3